MEKTTRKKLLEVDDLRQYFNAGRKSEIRAVDGISFYIEEGETFGLVGESGCGKSTTGRSIVRLYTPTSGRILFNGEDIASMKHRERLRRYRREAQMIFQDPYASLNPRMKVKDIIAEGIDLHAPAKTAAERNERVCELLGLVGLDESHASRYPHEFSGGQRQRIGIARALAVKPRFIVCDEPISALDVSIQAQVVNLLQDLQKSKKLTYLFIAHDLSMVKFISDRIGVMFRGKLVEAGTSEEIYKYGVHPYTESLLSAIPLPDPECERTRKRIAYTHQAPGEDAKLREVAPSHFVFCAEAEVAYYQAKLEKRRNEG